MPTPRHELAPETVQCPFMDAPCPQGATQGLQCLYRVAQDFDPMTRFHDFEVISCALCQREIRVAELARSIATQDRN